MLRIQPGTAYLTAFQLVEKGIDIPFVEVASISAPSDRTFPSDAIVLPYGGKAREKLSANLAAEANGSNRELYQIEVGVDIDRLRVKVLTLDSLRTTSLMNTKLIGKCIEATIIDYWCHYLEEEGKDIDWIIANFGQDLRAYISNRPDLLGRLSGEKEFQHLNMIVFTLITPEDSIDVGMILNRDAITQKGCKTDPFLEVVIPKV